MSETSVTTLKCWEKVIQES